jgi:hypothetical protein
VQDQVPTSWLPPAVPPRTHKLVICPAHWSLPVIIHLINDPGSGSRSERVPTELIISTPEEKSEAREFRAGQLVRVRLPEALRFTPDVALHRRRGTTKHFPFGTADRYSTRTPEHRSATAPGNRCAALPRRTQVVLHRTHTHLLVLRPLLE